MNAINGVLDEADIEWRPGHSVRGPIDAKVDVGDRRLCRIFNNGHTNFGHGGRMYGGFRMKVPQEDRLRAIRIQGEEVAELDFGSMNPRLLYAHVNQLFPAHRDPYLIPGLPPTARDGIKTYFNALLFGGTALKRWAVGCKEQFPKGTKREAVLDLLRQCHPDLAPKFGTLVGFELMKMESDIMVAVLLTCFSCGITALPIHDGLLCPRSKARELEAIMKDTFKEKTDGGVAVVRASIGEDAGA
jgi:hypothetical protein